ncbi:MAG: hypothetical protein IH865_07775 [Chloroflexi bacterium]|nr:hypothetical protein [Chloroflexota bacterium]
MRLMLAARIVVLLVVIYMLAGVAIYFSDIARDWCGYGTFDWSTAVWYMPYWPFRLFAGMFCD